MVINIQKKDLLWSYIGAALSMTANIIMIPAFVYYLTSNMLGLWYIFCSIGAMTSLFDFGFSTTFARNITYCWSGVSRLKKDDVDIVSTSSFDWSLLTNVLFVCKRVYLYISVFIFCLLATVGSIYIYMISKNIFDYKVCIAWMVYIIALFFNIYYGYFVAFLRGIGQIAAVNKNTVFARIIQIVMSIIVLYLGFGIIGACIAYLLYGFVLRWLCRKDFYTYQNISSNISSSYLDEKKQKEIFATVWHNAWRDGVVSLSNYLSDQACIIIISFYFSLKIIGEYSLIIQITTAIGIVSTIVYSAFQPVIQSAYAKRDKEKIIKTMAVIIYIYILSFIVLALLSVLIGIPVLEAIKKDLEINIFLFLLASLYQFILRLRNCYTSYFSCTNRIPYVTSFIYTSLASIIFSIVSISYLTINIYIVICVQIISQLIFNAWYWAQKVHRELGISFIELLRLGFNIIEIKIKSRMESEK